METSVKLKKFLEKELIKYNEFLPEGKSFGDAINLFINGRVSAGWTSKACKQYIQYFEAYIPRYKYKTWFLKDYGLKHCTKCDKVLPRINFTKKKGRGDGLKPYCKNCVINIRLENIDNARAYGRDHYSKNKGYYKARARSREISKFNRTPLWSQKGLIRKFYEKCPEGNHVDHIIPLQGELVSGLHVIENLQYLPIEENLKKGNKFEV